MAADKGVSEGAREGRRPTLPAAGKPIAEFQADLAQRVMGEYQQASRAATAAPGTKMVMPGGRIVDATPYLESRYRFSEHATAYGQIAKWLTPEWEADHPGYQYAWPKATDTMLGARVRAGHYVYVPREALRDDCPLPYMETVGVKGEAAIQIGDVICVAVSPVAYERLFTAPTQAAGVAAVAGNLAEFYAGVDQDGGRADAWVDKAP